MATTKQAPQSVGSTISQLLHRDGPLGYLLLSPGFVFLTVMMAYPFFYAVYLSFTDKQMGSVANFTGLENYTKLLSTNLFSKTVANSLVYTSLALALKFCGGMGLAVMLNRPFIGQRIIKALLLLKKVILRRLCCLFL